MRPLSRILLALAMGLASEMLFGQDPAPQGSESNAPAPAPAVEDGAAVPGETITAPPDAMPSIEPAAEAEPASVPGDAPADVPTPVARAAASRVEDRVAPPPPPPPAPGVDVAIGSIDDAELGPSGRKSDWFFLAVLAVAVAVIAVKLLHTRSERVSIHEDRRLGGLW
jgi:hypothetical protein